MLASQPRYSKQEHARKGRDIYERVVRPQVEGANLDRIVAIDIETGEFEIADDTLMATQRLLARAPGAQIWCERIGHEGVYRFGFGTRPASTDGA